VEGFGPIKDVRTRAAQHLIHQRAAQVTGQRVGLLMCRERIPHTTHEHVQQFCHVHLVADRGWLAILLDEILAHGVRKVSGLVGTRLAVVQLQQHRLELVEEGGRDGE